MLVISNRRQAARSSDFEVTRPQNSLFVFHSVQSLLLIIFLVVRLLSQLGNELASCLICLIKWEKCWKLVIVLNSLFIIRGYFLLIIFDVLLFLVLVVITLKCYRRINEARYWPSQADLINFGSVWLPAGERKLAN